MGCVANEWGKIPVVRVEFGSRWEYLLVRKINVLFNHYTRNHL